MSADTSRPVGAATPVSAPPADEDVVTADEVVAPEDDVVAPDEDVVPDDEVEVLVPPEEVVAAPEEVVAAPEEVPATAEEVLAEEVAPIPEPPSPGLPTELSGTPTERLRQLGIDLPSVAPPAGDYVPAVRTGNLVFTSGQLPMVDGALHLTGVVGDESVDVPVDRARALARICAVNALAAIAELTDLDRVRRVVKVVGFVASAPGFTQQPAVVDGASELFGQVWGDAGRHARSAVGVIALPRNAPVEVEVVVELDDDAATGL